MSDTSHTRQSDGFRTGGGRRMAWLAPALAVALLFGCERDRPGAELSAEQIMDDPDAYVGKQVTVGGEVGRTAGARAFTLEGGLGEGELLVLGAPPRKEGEEVRVTGKVRILTVAEVERELGWDLEREIEVEFERKPVLLASETAAKPLAGDAPDDSAAREDPAEPSA